MNAAAERHGMKLLCGHTHSFDPPIRKMREMVRSGELGQLGMIQTWNYNEFMYRPRMPQELDSTSGGGVVFNQGPHQVDMVRLIGGGLVRSVRGMTGIWDAARPTEGAYTATWSSRTARRRRSCTTATATSTPPSYTYWIGEGGQRPRLRDLNFADAWRG